MTDVPSNLIPTRVTQLPTSPVASEDGWLLYVYNGNTYKVRAGDLLSVAGVPTTRQVIAGTGMTGGGLLESNVTLSIAPGGVGTSLLADSGVTSGVYGDSTHVPVITIDATGRIIAATSAAVEISGYVPESRQVIAGTGLTGGGALNTNVTLDVNFSDSTPTSLSDSGTSGSATTVSRSDHQHPAIDLSSPTQKTGVLGLANGGTAKSITPVDGGIVWSGADGLYVGPAGTSGQVLISSGAGEYSWGSALIVSNQPANYIYASPTSGGAGPTTFRSMVNADLPDSGVTANSYGSATESATVTVNSKGVVTSVSVNNIIATNIAGGAASQIPYQSGANSTAFLANGTAGQVLTSGGASAPSWSGINGGTF